MEALCSNDCTKKNYSRDILRDVHSCTQKMFTSVLFTISK